MNALSVWETCLTDTDDEHSVEGNQGEAGHCASHMTALQNDSTSYFAAEK